MKTTTLSLFFLSSICVMTVLCLPSPSSADDWTGNVNVVFGSQRLDDDQWKPIDSQPGFGLMLDARQKDWPIGLALDFYHNEDQGSAGGISRDGSTTETDFGIRKIWRSSKTMRPFIGVGSSLIYASLKDSSEGVEPRSDSDTGAGVWIGGGLYWTLAEYFNIGFNLKYSTAKVTLLDDRFDAGGRFFGTVIGLTW